MEIPKDRFPESVAKAREYGADYPFYLAQYLKKYKEDISAAVNDPDALNESGALKNEIKLLKDEIKTLKSNIKEIKTLFEEGE
jgi:hypothetical protein